MQAAPLPSGQQTSVKIYNAVYSSVQVYECMVRGIAVMRRRADSYVNATQILKVAGVEKGRRTKILEKEVLPGTHEIVQGGYGKYQGTWIPLERGRELALQYGIAHLLAPLFEFMPNSSSMGSLSNSLSNLPGLHGGPRPLSAAATYPSLNASNSYSGHQLGPAPIMPGSALRLLHQGRAQGLFTPSTSSLQEAALARGAYYPGLLPGYSSQPTPSSSGLAQQTLKRTRTDSDLQFAMPSDRRSEASSGLGADSPDVVMIDVARPATAMSDRHVNGAEEPFSKRAKTDPPYAYSQLSSQPTPLVSSQGLRSHTATPRASHSNGLSREPSTSSVAPTLRGINGVGVNDRSIRLSTKPPSPRSLDLSAPLKNMKRSAVLNAICQGDNARLVLELLKDTAQDAQSLDGPPEDLDPIIDDMGHTPLHLAASLARLETVKALVSHGSDVYRGNYQGETPLIRAVLSTHNYDAQSFHKLLEVLYLSIRTVDTAKRSVLHHATLSAGVKGRAPYARYYLEGTLSWIAEHEEAEFRSLVDLQDEHGDTALNIAARVGNRSLVRTLLDVGANRLLPNKLGLRPGDFGLEPEELSGGPRAEDLLSSLRSGPSIPAQKSQDVIADLTNMIQKLSADFSTEIKSKQDTFDVTQAHLRAATRELADQRRQISMWQSRCGEYDQATQRIRNLEKATAEEEKFDWTGRASSKDDTLAGPAFAFRGSTSILTGSDAGAEVSHNLDCEPALPMTDSLASLVKLRRMKLYQDQIDGLLEGRLKGLQGASAEKEYMCKKIVALCTGIPIDKVEDMLENLVIAIESESQIIDIGRVSGFMQKVRDGII